MFDWTSGFPYMFIASIILLCIGIYGIISARNFLKVIFGIEFIFFASNILLLSLSLIDHTDEIIDPFAQMLSLVIVIVGVAFAIIGLAIDKKLHLLKESTMIEFNFYVEDGNDDFIKNNENMPSTEISNE